MNDKRLIRMLVVFFLTPLIVLATISACYLLMVVRSDVLTNIEEENRLYEFFLTNEARNALELDDSQYFQEIIDTLIKERHHHLLSVELIDNNRTTLASAPALPDLSGSAKRIPIMSKVLEDLDRFDFDLEANDSDEVRSKLVGYVVIRYNNDAVDVALNRVLRHLGLLLGIILLLLLVAYRLIDARLIRPFGFLNNRMAAMSKGELNVVEVKPDYLDACHRELNSLSKTIRTKDDIIENLDTQLVTTQSNVDFANLTKIEMMTELVNKLDKPVDTARSLLTQLGTNNTNPGLNDLIKYSSGCIDNIQRALSDTKIILDKTDMFVSFEQIRVKDFYDKLIEHIATPSINIVKGFMCDEAYLKHYVEIDDTHFYQLVSKLAQFAHGVNEPESVFINIRVEKLSARSASITIEIKDSGQVIASEDLDTINRYFHDEEKTVELAGMDNNTLRVIKYLLTASKATCMITSEYGRGHLYRVTLDTKFSSQLEMREEPAPKPVLSGFCFHDGSPDLAIKNHLRHVGIDITCNAIGDTVSTEKGINAVGSIDFSLLDFSAGNAEAGFRVARAIREKFSDSFMVAFVDMEQNSDPEFIERIFEVGISKVITKPYSASTLIDILKTNTHSDTQLIDKLLDQFTKSDD